MNVHSDKRNLLLDAAIALAARHGAEGFSMKALAKEADVAMGTAYGYFASREDLLLNAYLRCLSEVANVMGDAVSDEGSFAQQYRQVWMALWDYCQGHPEVMLCRSQFDNLPRAQTQLAEEHKQQAFEPIWQWLQAAAKAGDIPNVEQPVLSALCFEPCIALARSHLAGHIQLNPSQIQSFCDATLHSLTYGLSK